MTDAEIVGAVEQGLLAQGRAEMGLAVGEQADFVVLAVQETASTCAGDNAEMHGMDRMDGPSAADKLSSHVFGGRRGAVGAVDSVRMAGRERVAAGRHADHAEALAGLQAARRELLAP